MTRSFRGAARPITVVLISSVMAIALSVIVPTHSGAATGYQWAGKESATKWEGVEGDISVDAESVPNSTDYHILNYIDMSDFTATCHSEGSCWIQVGDELGYTGVPGVSVCHSSGIEAYVEEADVNAYHCGAYPTISLAQTDFYTEYNYGGKCNSGGDGIITAYLYNGSTLYHIGTAYFPECPAKSTLFAQSEFDEFNGASGNPTLAEYQYFGYKTTRWLGQSSNGKTWSQWTTSLTHGPNSPLHLTPDPVSGHDKFITWG